MGLVIFAMAECNCCGFLANKLRTLEAQNDLAERKLKEYKNELSKTGTVFLGDPTEFEKMLAEKENDHEASFMSKCCWLH